MKVELLLQKIFEEFINISGFIILKPIFMELDKINKKITGIQMSLRKKSFNKSKIRKYNHYIIDNRKTIETNNDVNKSQYKLKDLEEHYVE